MKQIKELIVKIDKEKLFDDNVNLAHHMVRKIKPRLNNYDYEDWIQISLSSLHKAIESYDDSKSAKFSTYACSIITNDILTEVRKQSAKFRGSNIKDSSLDFIICKDNKVKTMLEFIPSDVDIEEELIKELEHELKVVAIKINTKSKRQEIFNDCIMGSIKQETVSEIFNMSQGGLSKSIKKHKDNIQKTYEKLLSGGSVNYE